MTVNVVSIAIDKVQVFCIMQFMRRNRNCSQIIIR